MIPQTGAVLVSVSLGVSTERHMRNQDGLNGIYCAISALKNKTPEIHLNPDWFTQKSNNNRCKSLVCCLNQDSMQEGTQRCGEHCPHAWRSSNPQEDDNKKLGRRGAALKSWGG